MPRRATIIMNHDRGWSSYDVADNGRWVLLFWPDVDWSKWITCATWRARCVTSCTQYRHGHRLRHASFGWRELRAPSLSGFLSSLWGTVRCHVGARFNKPNCVKLLEIIKPRRKRIYFKIIAQPIIKVSKWACLWITIVWMLVWLKLMVEGSPI